ncbi:hypothetical protein [uncultured Corynebacterium sp.]|uniref:hypothetical protein n=1 Tax=uncultured Corynebacterium sp. TaxID=159447 RepID=UPI002636429F|nr:hypothetical protein [uncultured Corynebacterium sp.]
MKLGDEGAVTVEAALALTSIILVTASIVAGMAALVASLLAVDTASAAARAYAVGVDYTPPRGTVEVKEFADLVTATARIPSPLGEMTSTAVCPMEGRHRAR